MSADTQAQPFFIPVDSRPAQAVEGWDGSTWFSGGVWLDSAQTSAFWRAAVNAGFRRAIAIAWQELALLAARRRLSATILARPLWGSSY